MHVDSGVHTQLCPPPAAPEPQSQALGKPPALLPFAQAIGDTELDSQPRSTHVRGLS